MLYTDISNLALIKESDLNGFVTVYILYKVNEGYKE